MVKKRLKKEKVHEKKWWKERANAKRKKHQGEWISTNGKRRMDNYLGNKATGGQKNNWENQDDEKDEHQPRKAKWERGQTTIRKRFARGNGT